MIGGLLEGAAFLAARVQLKLKHEFSDFTTNSDRSTRAALSCADAVVPARAGAAEIRRLRAARRTDDCPRRQFRRHLSRSSSATSPADSHWRRPITLWPLEIVKARIFHQRRRSAGIDPGRGRRMRGGPAPATHRAGAPRSSRTNRPTRRRRRGRSCDSPHAASRSCVFICSARRRTRSRFTSRLFAHCRGVYFRFLDAFGDPVVVAGDERHDRQIGFEEDEALIPNDKRLFRGFDFLRDYFAFPRRFLGFDLIGARRGRAAARRQDRRYRRRFRRRQSAPRRGGAARSFSRFTPRPRSICSRRRSIAFPSNPTSTNILSCPTAAARSTSSRTASSSVFAHIPGVTQKVAVEPLYSATAARSASGLCYTVRRLPRRRTDRRKEIRTGVGLHRHRHVPFAWRAIRPARRSTASPN